MNRLVLVIAIVMALGLSLVAVTPAASASTEKPTWSAGDYWVYSLNLKAILPTLNAQATLRYDVVGPDSTPIGSTTVATYKTKLNLTASVSFGTGSISIYFNGNAWFRQSDLAPAELTMSSTIGTQTFSLTTTYDPPQTIQWPLNASASWSSTSNVTATSGGTPSTIMETFTNTVQADQSITVPAGTFMTTPVKQTITIGGVVQSTYTVSYWSGTAGNYASQRQYYTSNNSQVSSQDLQSYSFGGGGISLSSIVLGLPLYAWIAIIVIVVVVIAAVVMLRRKKPAPPMMPPPGTMPPGPGLPPVGPPQGPPPQP